MRLREVWCHPSQDRRRRHLWPPIASFRMKALMEVTIHHLGDVKFEANARGHRVICDQPAENGGSDSGMTPPEYLLVSLGACAGFYAAQYMKARSLAHQSLDVKGQRGEGGAAGEARTVSDRGGCPGTGSAASGRGPARGEGVPDSQHPAPRACDRNSGEHAG